MCAMDIFLTNTLTRGKDRFTPIDPARVTMYLCGPTVYNPAHIGNFRPPVVFDVLFRLLRRRYGEGSVVYARNFTDIDDRIIAKANAAGETIGAITEPLARLYQENSAALGVLRPTHEPRATAHVDRMISLIDRLISCGCAYAVPSGVYFCVAEDGDYGKLSRRSQEELLAGARVDGEDDKRHPSDFALWKAARPDEPRWAAPFGAGRPGWHIECSAMIAAALGETIDIHAGGIDLVFPHHENEIAQSESATGKPLARFWLHNGFLDMNGVKMSKSLGNVVLVNDLLASWPGEAIRWALLSAHYRAPLDFTDELLTQSRANLHRLYGALLRLDDIFAAEREAPAAFVEALCDDLNTPKAMAVLAELATAANTAKKPAAQGEAKGDLLAAAALLGVCQQTPKAWFQFGDPADIAEIERLVAERSAARAAKDWGAADALRGRLAAIGVEVLDSAAGSAWRRIA
jgi:cysteinyl-tRNA synthetase